MNKLRFFFGTMGSAKSSTLLVKAHQFEECGCNTILIKPSFDTRDTEIKSRAIERGKKCLSFGKKDDIYKIIKREMKKVNNKKTLVLCDEVQFSTREQVKQLWMVSKKLNVDVYCFGLKINYQNRLFDASEELLILADAIEEIKSMCRCGNKATTHLRVVNDIAVFNGDSNIVGDIIGSERYESVCTKCWFEEFDK